MTVSIRFRIASHRFRSAATIRKRPCLQLCRRGSPASQFVGNRRLMCIRLVVIADLHVPLVRSQSGKAVTTSGLQFCACTPIAKVPPNLRPRAPRSCRGAETGIRRCLAEYSLLRQLTPNHRVPGSNPGAPTVPSILTADVQRRSDRRAAPVAA